MTGETGAGHFDLPQHSGSTSDSLSSGETSLALRALGFFLGAPGRPLSPLNLDLTSRLDVGINPFEP